MKEPEELKEQGENMSSPLLPMLVVKDESLATSFTTEFIDMQHLDGFCATIVATGTPVGEFIVEGTVDGETWIQLSQTNAQMLCLGSSIDFKLNFLQIQDPRIRFTYIAASGTGTCTIWLVGKATGGGHR